MLGSLERESGCGSGLLLQFALHLLSGERELFVRGLEQPVVQTADMLDRAQALRRNAELEAAVQTFGHERDVLQVRQEDALGLIVGVADVVADLAALAGQFANTGHGKTRFEKLVPIRGKARQYRFTLARSRHCGQFRRNEPLAPSQTDAIGPGTGPHRRICG